MEEFESNEVLDRLYIPCYDHFKGKNMGGVNVYRNTVKWKKNEDNFFTDRAHLKETIREFKKWEVLEEQPLIHHSPDPSPFQAFHFGLHRMMKVIQPGKGFREVTIRKNNWYLFKSIKERYDHYKYENLLYALSGADAALRYPLKSEDISYGNKKVEKIFDQYCKKIEQREDIHVLCSKLFRNLKLPQPADYWFTFIRYRIKSYFS